MRYCLGLIWLFISQSSHAQIVVVVAQNTSIETLTSDYVANIFLARTTRFPNGQKAAPIELQNTASRADFYSVISSKNLSQLNAYWTTLVFTGKGKPPRAYADIDDLVAKLQSQPGAITYVDANQVTDAMKVVYRFP